MDLSERHQYTQHIPNCTLLMLCDAPHSMQLPGQAHGFKGRPVKDSLSRPHSTLGSMIGMIQKDHLSYFWASICTSLSSLPFQVDPSAAEI